MEGGLPAKIASAVERLLKFLDLLVRGSLGRNHPVSSSLTIPDRDGRLDRGVLTDASIANMGDAGKETSVAL